MSKSVKSLYRNIITIVLCLNFIAPLLSNEAKNQTKPWTVMLWIAADNDLEIFLERNLKQMAKIGSNQQVNIVAFISGFDVSKQQKTAKYALVEKGSVKILSTQTDPQLTDSGNPDLLAHFCLTAIQDFPAEKYALIFWDHGTGVIDPHRQARINMTEFAPFFEFENPHYGPSYFEELSQQDNIRGVCFDETARTYLTEQKIRYALNTICTKGLGGKKLDLIGFDACLMAMIEIAAFLEPYADYMVGSQEVELGTGWDYSRALSIFQNTDPSPQELGTHITQAYAKTYSFTSDYTFSCLDLKKLPAFIELFKKLSSFLCEAIKKQPSLKDFIASGRYHHTCTHFDDPDYIDAHHLLTNLMNKVNTSKYGDKKESKEFQSTLKAILSETIACLEAVVVANRCGSYFPHATGASLYFPEYSIHRSYKKNKFAQESGWFQFLHTYLSL